MTQQVQRRRQQVAESFAPELAFGQGQMELQRLVACLVLRNDAGAVRGHPARIVTVLPMAVKYNDGQTTGRVAAARLLFVDHGSPHCISIEIKRVRFQITIS